MTRPLDTIQVHQLSFKINKDIAIRYLNRVDLKGKLMCVFTGSSLQVKSIAMPRTGKMTILDDCP
jgi:hypothetical protein